MVEEPSETIVVDEDKKDIPEMKDMYSLTELMEYAEFNQNRMTSITGIVNHNDYIFSLSILNDHKENKILIQLESHEFRYVHVDDRMEDSPPNKYGEQKNSTYFNFDFETPWGHIEEKIIIQIKADKTIVEPLVKHATKVQAEYQERAKAKMEEHRKILEMRFRWVKNKAIQSGGYWQCKNCKYEYLPDQAIKHEKPLCKSLRFRKKDMSDPHSIRHLMPELKAKHQEYVEQDKQRKKDKPKKPTLKKKRSEAESAE